MKVAIIHYWLVGMRGGEKVLEALLDLFPQADIFTHVLDPERISAKLADRVKAASFINGLPWARGHYPLYLPLMPYALEQFDLRDYDLILSSESGPAKGVIVPPGVPHICYCHSPMRYIWDLYPDYRARAGRLKRLLMAWQSHRLRIWDQLSANRVDHFIANSGFVADRIRSYYRRDSRVIHPPVDTDAFGPAAATDDFYLLYGQLVGYKRADLAIEAFNASGRRLLVIGAGQELTRLKRAARGNIEFLGFQPDAVVRDHLARCRALIFPGVEDFGITPVEAMASGRPVIAFGRGGALDTVREGLSGLFFQQASAADLNRAIDRFEATASQFQPERIREWSKRFDRSVFLRRIGAFIEEFGMPEVDR